MANTPTPKLGAPTKWDRDRVVAAMQAWAEAHGRIPRTTDAGPGTGLPAPVTVVRYCGGWREALAQAGLIANPASDYEVDPFGAAAGDIRAACERALQHSGSMSQGEYERLQALLAVATEAIA